MTTKTMKPVSNREARIFITKRKPFVNHTGSFRGTVHYGEPIYTGLMPHANDERDALMTDNEFGNIEYIVWSYDTPIAWYNRRTGKWTRTAYKYSATTSGKHMNNLGDI